MLASMVCLLAMASESAGRELLAAGRPGISANGKYAQPMPGFHVSACRSCSIRRVKCVLAADCVAACVAPAQSRR